MDNKLFFNAHHSPIGAFSSFTLGFPGRSGGLDLEQGRPPEQNIYIGLQDLNASHPTVAGQKAVPEATYQALPFFETIADDSARYTGESAATNGENGSSSASSSAAASLTEQAPAPLIRPFPMEEIERTFGAAADQWRAGDLTVTLYSPFASVPDPETASEEELKFVLVPAVWAEITVDNTKGTTPRRAFFGFQGTDPYTAIRRLEDTTDGEICGVGQGRHLAIAALRHPQIRSAGHFTMENILQPVSEDNLLFGLGPVGALLMDTPAGEQATYRLAVCFYRGGVVTTGLDASYMYSRYFGNIEEVAAYALQQFDRKLELSRENDRMISESALTDHQQFMLAHAIRSYYGCTEFLDQEGKPLWVVNEGEYRMINTFDLTVDQLFFEIRMNPWTVRNELDWFAGRYRYEDTVRFPGDPTPYPGGVSFTHDMGVANTFSRPGYSSYEQHALTGCFSHMTQEQLVNWVLTAAVYYRQTGDERWMNGKLDLLESCLSSMVNRDHPEDDKRNGLMGLDSSRTQGGAEITTYDSLDVSLGQARNNIYLGGKSWAAYVALESIFEQSGRTDAARLAGLQAERSASTIAAHITVEGYIPAVIQEDNDSRIIPAIEGLIFPLYTGDQQALDPEGRFGGYIQALKRHFYTVLKPGVCLFPDGGWKLSSSSDNSWLSKIYLCQFIARTVFGLQQDEALDRADAAHAAWLTSPVNAIWSWSDQMVAGVIHGSRYYPRGVTAILWLDEQLAANRAGRAGRTGSETPVS
ncbi:beta-xylosidase [Paenibacillus yonginensis]|uniref:Beta-xylosidase n=1 Tax=Paenibacillus yonginensis TaxID=1462996 RepID=A0A1B1N0W6_9BACL|nr:glycoside hydrolase family 52 protein [Paenibacillus yonginensis]ANS75077.1 beta-xylosidase [Paenibacillus yonginensis]